MKQGVTAVTAVGLLLAVILVTVVIGAEGAGSPAGSGEGLSSRAAVPAAFLPWVTRAAALCPLESPALIAAQDRVESGFSTTAVSPTGAVGPAQMLPSTFAVWGRDDDGTGAASPTDIADAVMAQGRLMCSLIALAAASGYPGGTVQLALAGYNAGWQAVRTYHGIPPYPETTAYVQQVMATAAAWTATTSPTGAPALAGNGVGAAVVRRAEEWLGTPYVYGGGTPAGPTSGFCAGTAGMLAGTCYAATHSGFDCSSLIQLAWWPVVHLPRTAADQYSATAARTVPVGSLQPGDLLFYHLTSRSGIDHVALYAGAGQVVQAPSTGATVEVVALYTTGLVAATRPT